MMVYRKVVVDPSGSGHILMQVKYFLRDKLPFSKYNLTGHLFAFKESGGGYLMQTLPLALRFGIS